MAEFKLPDPPRRYPIKLAEKGRLVLPAALRKAAGLQPGEHLVARLETDGSIRLWKERDSVAALMGHFKHLKTDGGSIVDELMAERRAEARREEEESGGHGS